jgi:hypothetical protein
MSGIRDEAQSLFEAGRAGHEPRAEDRERVLRGVLVRVGVVTSTLAAHSASASSAAGGGASIAGAASASSLAGLGAKLVLGLALAGSAGAGLYHYVRPHASEQALPAPALSARFASRSAPPAFAEPGAEPGIAPRLAEPELPSGAASAARVGGTAPSSRGDVRANDVTEAAGAVPEIAPAGEVSAPRASSVAAFPELGAPAASKPALAAPKSSASGAVLSAEARALADAQRALREGRNSEALSRIEQQESQFASGELGQERRAAKIVALCALGRVTEARALALRFLADSPRSPLAARIRATCAVP